MITMLNTFTTTIQYITADLYFWPSMAFTTVIGIFVGSVVYNGDMKELRKGLILLVSYCCMVLFVTTTRVMPQLKTTTHAYQLFSGIFTLAIVTLFYLVGMFLGVRITKFAHKHKEVSK